MHSPSDTGARENNKQADKHKVVCLAETPQQTGLWPLMVSRVLTPSTILLHTHTPLSLSLSAQAIYCEPSHCLEETNTHIKIHPTPILFFSFSLSLSFSSVLHCPQKSIVGSIRDGGNPGHLLFHTAPSTPAVDFVGKKQQQRSNILNTESN